MPLILHRLAIKNFPGFSRHAAKFPFEQIKRYVRVLRDESTLLGNKAQLLNGLIGVFNLDTELPLRKALDFVVINRYNASCALKQFTDAYAVVSRVPRMEERNCRILLIVVSPVLIWRYIACSR